MSVLIGDVVVVDRDLLRDLATAKFAALGIDGVIREADDFAAALVKAPGAIVALPGPDGIVLHELEPPTGSGATPRSVRAQRLDEEGDERVTL